MMRHTIDDHADAVARLRQVGRQALPVIDVDTEAAHLALISVAVADVSRQRRATRTQSRRSLRLVAATVGAIVVVGVPSMALAGALPARLQHAVATLASQAGVSMPDSSANHATPATGSPAATAPRPVTGERPDLSRADRDAQESVRDAAHAQRGARDDAAPDRTQPDSDQAANTARQHGTNRTTPAPARRPAHPVHPVHPVHPTHPATPSRGTRPVSSPARPATPAKPAIPATPAKPAGGGQPASPAQPAAPAQSVTPAQPAAPATAPADAPDGAGASGSHAQPHSAASQ